MQAGEVTVKVTVEMSDDAKELIRQIVREEIAAIRDEEQRQIRHSLQQGAFTGDITVHATGSNS